MCRPYLLPPPRALLLGPQLAAAATLALLHALALAYFVETAGAPFLKLSETLLLAAWLAAAVSAAS